MYLDEKIALAIDSILYNFEGLAVVYMKVFCVFHPRNITHRNRCSCSNGTSNTEKEGEEEERRRHGVAKQLGIFPHFPLVAMHKTAINRWRGVRDRWWWMQPFGLLEGGPFWFICVNWLILFCWFVGYFMVRFPVISTRDP